MKLTVDANILFGCLIKEGKTRKLWFNPELQLFAPKFILTEFLKYRKMVERKSGLNAEKFDKLLELVVSQVKLINSRELKPYIPAVASLVIDDKDWLYLACALKEDTAIWSNDNGFRGQKRVNIFATSELMQMVGTL